MWLNPSSLWLKSKAVMKMNRGDELLRPESLKQTTTFVGRGDIHSKSCERNISCFSSFYVKTNQSYFQTPRRWRKPGGRCWTWGRAAATGSGWGRPAGRPWRSWSARGRPRGCCESGPLSGRGTCRSATWVKTTCYYCDIVHVTIQTYIVKPQLAQISRMGWILAIIILSACADKSWAESPEHFGKLNEASRKKSTQHFIIKYHSYLVPSNITVW